MCVCVPFYFQISIYISQKLTITREPGMKLSLHFGQRLKITFNLWRQKSHSDEMEDAIFHFLGLTGFGAYLFEIPVKYLSIYAFSTVDFFLCSVKVVPKFH